MFVVAWSAWYAGSTAGYTQVQSYIQLVYKEIDPIDGVSIILHKSMHIYIEVCNTIDNVLETANILHNFFFRTNITEL